MEPYKRMVHTDHMYSRIHPVVCTRCRAVLIPDGTKDRELVGMICPNAEEHARLDDLRRQQQKDIVLWREVVSQSYSE